jgi:DNA-binding LacI/PurR family transcriptional regulator
MTNDNGNGRYQRDDARLLIALASGATIKRAAELGGVSVATVMRRLEEEEFRRELARVRSEMIDRAVAKLASSLSAASTTLRTLLGASSETVRLGAARAIHELHCRWRESVELEERLSELERQLGGASR